MTERGPVSPDGVMLVSPTELAVDLLSCNGDPVVDELVEDDEQVSIRIVTTMVVSGDGDDCADSLPVTLAEPLGERPLIDLVSGDTLTVVELDTGADPDASRTERRPVTPDEVGLASPTELSVTISSCGGNPVVDEIEEDDAQVLIRIVTTAAESGDDCQDVLTIALDDPLDGRTLIDLVSGETLTATERRPVSLAGWNVYQVGPEDLSFEVPCSGNPVVEELVEDGEQIRIKIVTTVVVSGEAPGCLGSLDVSLRDPLGDRAIIDGESGETLSVVPFDADPDSLAGLCEEVEVALAEGEPGRDSPEEAIEAFVANENGFLADVTFDGEQIIYEGEVVGRMSVRSMPAGGHLVTSAQWCYPDDY